MAESGTSGVAVLHQLAGSHASFHALHQLQQTLFRPCAAISIVVFDVAEPIQYEGILRVHFLVHALRWDTIEEAVTAFTASDGWRDTLRYAVEHFVGSRRAALKGLAPTATALGSPDCEGDDGGAGTDAETEVADNVDVLDAVLAFLRTRDRAALALPDAWPDAALERVALLLYRALGMLLLRGLFYRTTLDGTRPRRKAPRGGGGLPTVVLPLVDRHWIRNAWTTAVEFDEGRLAVADAPYDANANVPLDRAAELHELRTTDDGILHDMMSAGDYDATVLPRRDKRPHTAFLVHKDDLWQVQSATAVVGADGRVYPAALDGEPLDEGVMAPAILRTFYPAEVDLALLLVAARGGPNREQLLRVARFAETEEVGEFNEVTVVPNDTDVVVPRLEDGSATVGLAQRLLALAGQNGDIAASHAHLLYGTCIGEDDEGVAGLRLYVSAAAHLDAAGVASASGLECLTALLQDAVAAEATRTEERLSAALDAATVHASRQQTEGDGVPILGSPALTSAPADATPTEIHAQLIADTEGIERCAAQPQRVLELLGFSSEMIRGLQPLLRGLQMSATAAWPPGLIRAVADAIGEARVTLRAPLALHIASVALLRAAPRLAKMHCAAAGWDAATQAEMSQRWGHLLDSCAAVPRRLTPRTTTYAAATKRTTAAPPASAGAATNNDATFDTTADDAPQDAGLVLEQPPNALDVYDIMELLIDAMPLHALGLLLRRSHGLRLARRLDDHDGAFATGATSGHRLSNSGIAGWGDGDVLGTLVQALMLATCDEDETSVASGAGLGSNMPKFQPSGDAEVEVLTPRLAQALRVAACWGHLLLSTAAHMDGALPSRFEWPLAAARRVTADPRYLLRWSLAAADGTLGALHARRRHATAVDALFARGGAPAPDVMVLPVPIAHIAAWVSLAALSLVLPSPALAAPAGDVEVARAARQLHAAAAAGLDALDASWAAQCSRSLFWHTELTRRDGPWGVFRFFSGSLRVVAGRGTAACACLCFRGLDAALSDRVAVAAALGELS